MPVQKKASSIDAAQLDPSPLDDNFRHGLRMLWRAQTFARDAAADQWDFALEIDKLYDAGLTISDLRWLIAKGLAEHAQETSFYGDAHRTFRPSDGFNFATTTCVVLTPSGVLFADRVSNESETTLQSINAAPIKRSEKFVPPSDRAFENKPQNPQYDVKPYWDSALRELRLAETIVKRFRVPAQNQETILCVFEEEGWPTHIDDPLPVCGDIDPHGRLHDTINRLNGHQSNRLLRFHGNGHGTGVLWEQLISLKSEK